MSKLDEAKHILEDLGLPIKQQNDRSGYTLLALTNIKEYDMWDKANNRLIGIHNIMKYIDDYYDKKYAENSRETFRRQTIHQFEQAGIIERNADDPTRPTNSGKTVYSITNEVLKVIKTYDTEEWENAVTDFLADKKKLVEQYMKKRNIHKVKVKIEDKIYELSSGEHNDLQKYIIEEFGSRFAQGSKLLYVGDTAQKDTYIKKDELEELGIPITKHSKLPDVVLYHPIKNWLFLCEAVTSHGPVSPKRVNELEQMLSNCDCGVIYVSCFLDFKTYKKYASDIAWETEIWISENPDHMIHLNGDRFLGPR